MNTEFLVTASKHAKPSISDNAQALLWVYKVISDLGETLEIPQYTGKSDKELRLYLINLKYHWREALLGEILNKHIPEQGDVNNLFKVSIIETCARYLSEVSFIK